VTLLSLPTDDPQTAAKNQFLSALIFFLVAAVFMFVCCVFQTILYKNAFYIYYLDWFKNPKYGRKDKIMNSPEISEQDRSDYGLILDVSQK